MIDRKQFIKDQTDLTDRLNKVITDFSSKLELDWRDSSEIEIHNFDQDLDSDSLVDLLNQNGFKVKRYNFRYRETLRIDFEGDYYGSYGLEDYNEEDWNDFVKEL